MKTSKIEQAILAATGYTPKRGDDRQDVLSALAFAVQDLKDEDWESLSAEAQKWHGEAVDVINANKAAVKKDAKAKLDDLPDFPDLVEDEPAKASGGRRRASDDAGAYEPKVGDKVHLVTSRGKEVDGEVIEVTEKIVALKHAEGEDDYDRERIKSITKWEAEGGGDEPAADFKPKVGMEVELKTKRGRDFAGTIVEIDGDVLVIKGADGKDEDFNLERIETIKLKGGAKAAASSGRRSDTADDKPAEGEKTKRASNPEGVSIGQRIKELMADNLDASEADIAKLLKKEGIEFKENTLTLNFKDVQKTIAVFRAAKLMK